MGILQRPSSGVWAPVRDKLRTASPSFPGGIGRSVSQSSSDVESSTYGEARTLSSRVGSGSIAQGKHGGMGSGDAEEEGYSSYNGRYGYALTR